ncbi:MAG: hypothetical protein J7K73_02750 [Nanoarchaeota archaeon]|nr:hypothetical protein [Nanoarchaeota archaeon]
MSKVEVNPMSDELCEDLLNTLREIKAALELRDAPKLKELSDHTIHCSSIYKDKRAIYIAMITYSLSKILEKSEVQRQHSEELEDFMKGMDENFGALITFLENRDFEKFSKAIVSMLKEISEFDTSFGRYVEDVLEFAKVQKGAKMYEHGLSLSSVAEMLGVSKWDLMKKVGETKFHEELQTPKDIRERFRKLKQLLEKG